MAGAVVRCLDNPSLYGAVAVNPDGSSIGKGGGGSQVFLEEKIANNSASLVFAATISSKFDLYIIEAMNLVPVSTASLSLQVSTDGGATWDTGTVQRAAMPYSKEIDINNSTGPYSWAQYNGASIPLIPAATLASATIRLIDPASAVNKHFLWQAVWYGDVPLLAGAGGGSWENASPYTAVRLFFPGNAIVSGKARSYGIAKS